MDQMELRLAARKVAELEQAERRMSEELRQANEALGESERRWRDLFDEAPIAYVQERLDTRLIQANRAAMSILGTPSGGSLPPCRARPAGLRPIRDGAAE